MPERVGFPRRLSCETNGGRFFDLGLLARWAAMYGVEMHGVEATAGDLRIPAMPAGHYAYCLVTAGEAALVAAGRAAPVRCTAGTLTAGGELVLEWPAGSARQP